MTIDKRDFDANRPLLQNIDAEQDTTDRNAEPSWRYSRRGSRSSGNDGLSDDGLLSDVVEEIVERDRRRMQKEVIRVLSFGWGVVTWYGKLFFLAAMLTRRSISIGILEADSYIRVLQLGSRQHHCFLSVWPSSPYPTPLLAAPGQCCFYRCGTRNVPPRPLVRLLV